MGELIVLTERLADRARPRVQGRSGLRAHPRAKSRPGRGRLLAVARPSHAPPMAEARPGRARPRAEADPALFFDLACPFSYLAAEQAERLLGAVEWVPVAGPLRPECSEVDLRTAAETRATQLRLPLVWPERFPAPTRGALRAAMRAGQVGCGARFAIAAARLAFCGGFDLDDPEVLAEAAGASGFQLEECLAAARDESLDGALDATASGLLARGVNRLPAVRVGHGFFAGEALLSQAAAVSRAAGDYEFSVFP